MSFSKGNIFYSEEWTLACNSFEFYLVLLIDSDGDWAFIQKGIILGHHPGRPLLPSCDVEDRCLIEYKGRGESQTDCVAFFAADGEIFDAVGVVDEIDLFEVIVGEGVIFEELTGRDFVRG